MDAPGGLHCMTCLARGSLCSYGTGSDTATVYVSMLGTIGSMVALIFQVLVVSWALKKRGVTYEVSLFGLQAFVAVFLLLSVVACPIIFTLVGSDLATVLMLSSTAKTVLWVVASILALPTLIFLWMISTIFCADAECLDGCPCDLDCCECCGCC